MLDKKNCENEASAEAKKRKLLDYCSNYKMISDDGYYTYNDWKYYINKKN